MSRSQRSVEGCRRKQIEGCGEACFSVAERRELALIFDSKQRLDGLTMRTVAMPVKGFRLVATRWLSSSETSSGRHVPMVQSSTGRLAFTEPESICPVPNAFVQFIRVVLLRS